MAKIGIYGGTFNPPHLGHVLAAKAAKEALGLDKVLLVPDAQPPHKALPEGSPSPEQRVEMARLAAEGAVAGGQRAGAEPPGKKLYLGYPSGAFWEVSRRYPVSAYGNGYVPVPPYLA